jgi:hypothetical protein
MPLLTEPHCNPGKCAAKSFNYMCIASLCTINPLHLQMRPTVAAVSRPS